MKDEARAAALFMLGLALFHAYGAVIILYNVNNAVSIPMFGVYDAEDIPVYDVVKSKIFLVSLHLVLVYMLRWLVVGLRNLRSWAWYGSIILCLFLILVRGMMLNQIGDLKLQSDQKMLIGYCILTLFSLLIAAPAFLKQRRRPIDM